ncbi:hypothetical protein M7I_6574 [Glarea lozoyensis 74030]|uniref:Uncharacterized protein n=1 Tax=Glarea lozoyensis (strain ATCC 74030 / MF5533) TaxID=1104152 RepID=H0EUY4_GLAL7|nr:hypothetical protein M7I_6574 [Glarea lozoyensis 74030]
MPAMETITIINKSGKVVSTGKQLVNIFKDARDAYETKKKEKKEEMKAERQKRIAYKAAQNLIEAREDTASVASSRRSHRSTRSSRHHKDKALTSRPPLSHIPEGSVSSSQRNRSARPHGKRSSSQDGSRHPSPLFDDVQPGMVRRHTDLGAPAPGQMTRAGTLPPPYSLHRSVSDPDVRADKIDMNLAYGELHERPGSRDSNKEEELEEGLSKLESLLLEAHCVQHSATTIIANLQKNPEAMAAVALTLAELSNILKTMGPAVLASLKASSPAAFALLASPQFLIAGGVALGVTIVMFGGYKIVKQIKAKNELAAAQEANRQEEALVYDSFEMGSVESWRRGIADAESESIEGVYLTPGAVNTFATREIPIRSSSSKMLPAPSESGRSKRGESKGKELVIVSSEKKKKSSSLSVFLNKHKDKKVEKIHRSRPQLIEM